MPRPVRSFTMLGKRWRLVFKQLRKVWGYTYKEHGLLEIHNRLNDGELLHIVVHEVTHAGMPWLDEEYVEEFAADLSRLLWRLGYRREHEE